MTVFPTCNYWLRLIQGKLGKESSQASDPALGAALWTLSEQLVREKIGEDALVPCDS